MLYPVRVFDGEGNFLREHSSEELTERGRKALEPQARGVTLRTNVARQYRAYQARTDGPARHAKPRHDPDGYISEVEKKLAK